MPVMLDMNNLFTTFPYGRGNREIRLENALTLLRPTLEHWSSGEMELLTPVGSLGFAMANPNFAKSVVGRTNPNHVYSKVWDDPYRLTAFVGGWGPNWERYAANAVRKMRAAARVGKPTLDIFLREPELFQDKVESQEADGTYTWGDFPYGGATFVNFAEVPLLGAVSTYTQEEDHLVANMLLNVIALLMFRAEAPTR